MAGFILFLLAVLGVAAILLYTNKGEKAESIKSVLEKIFENLKDLASNLKELFIQIKSLLPEQEENIESVSQETSSEEVKEPSGVSDQSSTACEVPLTINEENKMNQDPSESNHKQSINSDREIPTSPVEVISDFETKESSGETTEESKTSRLDELDSTSQKVE